MTRTKITPCAGRERGRGFFPISRRIKEKKKKKKSTVFLYRDRGRPPPLLPYRLVTFHIIALRVIIEFLGESDTMLGRSREHHPPSSTCNFLCARQQEARCRRAWKIADREAYLLQQALYQQQQQQMQQHQQHQLHQLQQQQQRQLQLQQQQQLGARSSFSSASSLQGAGEYGGEPGAQQVCYPLLRNEAPSMVPVD